jgi:hypothetical protein
VSDALDGGYWPKLDINRLFKSFAVSFPRENEIWFFLPYKGETTSQTAMNHIMVYNYRKRTQINGKNVGLWHGPYSGFTRASAALIDYKVHAGGLNGILYDHDDAGKSDDGVALRRPSPQGPRLHLGADVRCGG